MAAYWSAGSVCLSCKSLIATDLCTGRPEFSPSLLAGAICEVPQQSITPFAEPAEALAGCNRELQLLVHSLHQQVNVQNTKITKRIVKCRWPQLAIVLLIQPFTIHMYWPWLSSLELMAILGLTSGGAGRAAFLVRSLLYEY